jgi:hypothetical protein
MTWFRGIALLGLAGMAVHLAAGPVGPQDPLIGRWRGVIVLQPAELETEVEVSFSRAENGAMGGRVSFLTSGDLDLPIHDFSRDDARVRFAVSDQSNVVSAFDGSLSLDGTQLDGDLAESGAHYLFTLHRTHAAEAQNSQRPLRRLSASGAELKQLFSQDPQRVRLLLILSSSCPVCRSGAGVVQRYVLGKVKDPRLAVYVIWEPVTAGDTEASARAVSHFLSDPRVVQFWAEDRFTGRAFARALGSREAPVWDVFLAFPGGRRWGAAAPAPSFVMSNMAGQGPAGYPRLNGVELAVKIKALLAEIGDPR